MLLLANIGEKKIIFLEREKHKMERVHFIIHFFIIHFYKKTKPNSPLLSL